jgi:Ca2+-binding EF-hand superfamily protein
MNTNSYYIESSQNNKNFLIQKINNKHKNNNIYHKSREKDINKYISFYNLLMDYIKQDNAIEITRQLLSTRDDVNLTDLFELFDNSSNHIITSMDFLETLKKFGLFLNIDEIKFLFRKFNKNLNECFDYEEFCEIVLPKKYSSAKIMSERQSKEYINDLTLESKKILSRLFNNIIEGEKSNENYRKIIGVNKEYTGFDLFNNIKKSYSIGIYKEDIANFMRKNKHRLSNGEIELLMERFDKNKDGLVDYKEFLSEISPMN